MQFVGNPFTGGQLMDQKMGSCVRCESVKTLGLKLQPELETESLNSYKML